MSESNIEKTSVDSSTSTNSVIDGVIEAINKNGYCSVWAVEDECEEFCNAGAEKVATGLDISKHRWFETSTNVYKIGERFIGINGISGLFSEEMSWSDCGINCEAFEMVECTKVSYEPLNRQK